MDRYDEISGTVTCYSYRKALVTDVICVLPRSLCREIEQQLATRAGTQPDNHVVYKVVQLETAEPVYIRFSDLSVTFAKSVEEYPNGY